MKHKYYGLNGREVHVLEGNINSKYARIANHRDYILLLNSGMFWEFHPELSGCWDDDREIIFRGEDKVSVMKDSDFKSIMMELPKEGVIEALMGAREKMKAFINHFPDGFKAGITAWWVDEDTNPSFAPFEKISKTQIEAKNAPKEATNV